MARTGNHSSFWRARITRRGVLRTAGGAIGVSLLGGGLAGCSSPSKEERGVAASPTAGEAKPQRGGMVRYVWAAQATDLNPQLTGNSGTAMAATVYDHPIYFNQVLNTYELGALQSLENPDPLTYILKLKPTARFHGIAPVNGRPVVATDMIASWEAFVANPRTSNKELFVTYFDRYDTPEPATLVIKFKKANAWFIGPNGLGGAVNMIIAPKEIAEKNQMNTVAIGSGAYVLENFDPAAGLLVKRRPDAWHVTDGRPYVDKVAWQVITDEAARAAAFKAKQIDQLAARDKLEMDEFKGFGPDVTIDKEVAFPSQLLMRADEDGYFRDPRVREAVYCALDIQELIGQVDLGEGVWTGPVFAELKKWALPDDELRKAYPHDVRKARQLLEAAGWDLNRVVDFKHPNQPRSSLLCQILQNQLGAAGIKTRLVPQDLRTVWQIQTIQNKDFQLTACDQSGRGQEPDLMLRGHTTDGAGGGNTCHWSDKDVDDLVSKLGVEFDPKKQDQIIGDAQRLLFKKFTPGINLYCPYSLVARRGYFHAVKAAEVGRVATYAHYGWIDVTHPEYPKDRQ